MSKKKAILAASVVFACAVSGTVSQNVSAQDNADQRANFTQEVKKSTSAEDGKNIFQALFFGTGPETETVTEAFGDDGYREIVKLAEGYDEEQKAAIEEILTTIEEEDPSFFERFSADVRSGSPRKVESALNEGAERLQATSNNDGTPSPASPVALVAVVVWAGLVWDAMAAVNYGVVVNIGGGAFVVTEVEFAGAASDYDLDTHALVAEITKVYAE